MSDVVLLDATTLIALGSIGELELLANFDGDLLIPERVAAEVTTEPARTNLDGFQSRADVSVLHVPDDHESVATAANILAADAQTGDVELLTGVLTFESSEVGVVSDDRRVRTVSSGLGARVTGGPSVWWFEQSVTGWTSKTGIDSSMNWTTTVST